MICGCESFGRARQKMLGCERCRTITKSDSRTSLVVKLLKFVGASAAGTKAGIAKDSRSISDRLSTGAVTVLLDPEGSEWSSQELAAQMQRWENQGTKEVAFIVGGPNGVSPELAASVTKRWSLSRLTLTHEMARVVLLEQLYRALYDHSGVAVSEMIYA